MSVWHLHELREVLLQKGWRILAELPGDGYGVPGSWAIQRSTHTSPLYIDFDGFDDMVCLPLSRAYGCGVRGHRVLSLYFGKSKRVWAGQLRAFIDGLDALP